METKKIEQVNYIYRYVASDGTEFEFQDECEKYEKSAKGVLKGRLAKMAITSRYEADLFNGSGSDENKSFVVIPKTAEDVSVIQQLCYLMAYNKEAMAAKVDVGKVLVVIFSYDDECAWVTDLGDVVSNATDGKYEIREKK